MQASHVQAKGVPGADMADISSSKTYPYDRILPMLVCGPAQAGAKHVYGIERSAIADQAELIVKDNGYDDRVTIIKGGCADHHVCPRGGVGIACDRPRAESAHRKQSSPGLPLSKLLS